MAIDPAAIHPIPITPNIGGPIVTLFLGFLQEQESTKSR